MISTPLRFKTLKHTRSISLPNRSHPLIPQFNDHLQRLKPCESSSLPSINKKLNNLENVHTCVYDLLLLPHTQQVFAQERQEKWVEETLDRYLSLVDTCATAKDFVVQSKQDMQEILSILRRRSDSEDLNGFLTSRKRSKKMIRKCVSSFKNKPTILALDKNQETIAIISMLKEAESVTLDVIELLLSSLSGNFQKTRGWSLVSRLIYSRKNSCNDIHEFEELDATVSKIVSGCDRGIEINGLLHQLRETESKIQGIEESLECLLKHLIKARVLLLNMQSQYNISTSTEDILYSWDKFYLFVMELYM